MIYCNLNESVIIKCCEKNYDSIISTGEEHIHYFNTIQNTHLFKKSDITSGVTLLLGEMKSHSLIIYFLCISSKVSDFLLGILMVYNTIKRLEI